MVQELSDTIRDLNNLYHNGLNGDKTQQKVFTDYVDEFRKEGKRFVNAVPDIFFENIVMTAYEIKLHEKLQLVRSEKKAAIENSLWRYHTNLREVESGLIHELSTILMRRNAIDEKYFWEYSNGRIAFNWSGHAMDIHVWWEEDGRYEHLNRIS